MLVADTFRSSLDEHLKRRGVLGRAAATCHVVVSELSHHLASRAPGEWSTSDLVRYFAQRVGTLDPETQRRYSEAIGVITELLHELGDGVSRDADEREASAEAVVGEATGRFETVHRAADDRVESGTGMWSRPDPTKRLERPRSDVHRLEGKIDLLFDRRTESVAMDWSGFVTGGDLRETMGRGLELQRLQGSHRWVVDMRRARVMAQQDSVWFADWLLEAGAQGVRWLAVVLPEHVITKMQIVRLRDATEASLASLDAKERVHIEFFDALAAARAWLARQTT